MSLFGMMLVKVWRMLWRIWTHWSYRAWLRLLRYVRFLVSGSCKARQYLLFYTWYLIAGSFEAICFSTWILLQLLPKHKSSYLHTHTHTQSWINEHRGTTEVHGFDLLPSARFYYWFLPLYMILSVVISVVWKTLVTYVLLSLVQVRNLHSEVGTRIRWSVRTAPRSVPWCRRRTCRLATDRTPRPPHLQRRTTSRTLLTMQRKPRPSCQPWTTLTHRGHRRSRPWTLTILPPKLRRIWTPVDWRAGTHRTVVTPRSCRRGISKCCGSRRANRTRVWAARRERTNHAWPCRVKVRVMVKVTISNSQSQMGM